MSPPSHQASLNSTPFLKMNHLLVLACCVCAISANPLQEVVQRVGHSRIIYGESIEIEDAPYQVSIIKIVDRIYGNQICGGSIISKNLILTAGHCAAMKSQEYAVRSGSTFWTNGGKLHRVVKIVSHEAYKVDNASRTYNDLAIMKVEPEFELNGKTERLSKLADKNDKVKAGENAYVIGWGRTETGEASDTLKGLFLKIVDFKKCSQDYKHFGEMTKYNICAAHPSGKKDMCNGDSGGPLVVKGKQVGIISWSEPGCATPGRPGVYTDVAHYREWIDKHMNL